MQTPTVIKLKHSRDLLAYVPHRLGYTPHCSLVLIGMRRKNSGTQLGLMVRCDLPRVWMDDPDVGTARHMIHNLLADTSVNAVVPVLYLDGVSPPEAAPASDAPASAAPEGTTASTDAPPADYGNEGPEPEAAAAIRVAADDIGLELVDELWVSGGRWRSYACADTTCCPSRGRSTTEIQSSAVGAELVLAGSSPADSVDALTSLPNVDADQIARVRRAAEAAADRRAAEMRRGRVVSWRRRQLEVWRRAFSSDPALIQPDRLGRLIVALSDSWLRDGVMLDIFGIGHHAGAVLAPDPEPATLEAMSRVVGASQAEPDPERLGSAERLLRVLAAVSTGSRRAAPLTVLGWIEWCRGRSSTAGNYLDRALEADPGHRLANLLTGFIDRGMLPSWITKPR